LLILPLQLLFSSVLLPYDHCHLLILGPAFLADNTALDPELSLVLGLAAGGLITH
jgi:hypothetical protein